MSGLSHPPHVQTMSSSETLVGANGNSAMISNSHKSNIAVNDLYKRTEVIGRGKFGIVYKGYNRRTNLVVAIKVLNLDTDQEEVKDVQQEILFLSQLKQAPNIIHYHGSYLSDTKLWIIMDYCAGGSVRSLLKPGRIEEKYIGVIVRELLIALQYVHRAGVIHRDLKLANVLITREGNVQLCDFGVAAQLTSSALKRTTMAGTPYWMAPEVIMEGAKYDVKVDIWSLGITIYEISTGNPPYSDKDAMRAMQLITKSKPPRLEGRNHSTLLKEMIALCLDENPDERPTADDLLKSKFIRAHKNTPNTILKEIISRYLLWREKKSSRDSMAMYGMDEEILENNSNLNISGVVEDDSLDLKWDFDSLNSSEYIMENDINVNQISHPPEYGEELYNDEEEFMMTTDQQTYMTGKDGPGAREDFTLRMTGSATVGHTMGTRREAPKSLLQLFEEEEEERGDMMGQLQAPNKSENEVVDSLPKLPTMPSSNVPRSASPMIEIPNMDDITLSEPPPKARSRAPTLSHTQSAAAVLGRATGEMTEIPTNISRRPTISLLNTPVSALPQSGFPVQFPPNLTQSTSSLSAVSGRTPSPKRQAANSTDAVNLSPQRISGMTPSSTMKPLPSSINMSALLQPINKPSSDLTSHVDPLSERSSPTPITSTQNPKNKNIANLHLNMPPPTSASPSLQALTNTDISRHHPPHPQQRSLSSTSSPAPRDGVRINQFGYDAAQALATPLTMTPLNEKSQLSAMNAFLNGPPTGSITPPRESRSRNGSTVNSITPGTASFFLSKDEAKKSKFPEMPVFQNSLLLENTEDCKQKLIEEIDALTTKFIMLMNTMEEDVTVYIE